MTESSTKLIIFVVLFQMDEYIESKATTGRVSRFKMLLKLDVYKNCVFIMRCGNHEDFRDYYFKEEYIDTPNVFELLHLCFYKLPDLFVALMKFKCMSLLDVNVCVFGSQYMFKISIAKKVMYENTGFMSNVLERLAILKFVPVIMHRRVFNYIYPH